MRRARRIFSATSCRAFMVSLLLLWGRPGYQIPTLMAMICEVGICWRRCRVTFCENHRFVQRGQWRRGRRARVGALRCAGCGRGHFRSRCLLRNRPMSRCRIARTFSRMSGLVRSGVGVLTVVSQSSKQVRHARPKNCRTPHCLWPTHPMRLIALDK